jgi:hypothetical protein
LIQSELLFHLLKKDAQGMYTRISVALAASEFPSAALQAEDKATFLRVLFNIQNSRRLKSLINDFSSVCNHQLSSDVFLSYEM